MAWYFFFVESFRSSVMSLSFHMQEEGEWLKSSMICEDVSLLGKLFNFVKALAWVSPRQRTNKRFLSLRVSLGSSSFCSCVMDALIPCLLMTLFTSAAEPLTRIFRRGLSPGSAVTSLPVPKHLLNTGAASCETSTQATMNAAEKIHSEWKPKHEIFEKPNHQIEG